MPSQRQQEEEEEQGVEIEGRFHQETFYCSYYESSIIDYLTVQDPGQCRVQLHLQSTMPHLVLIFTVPSFTNIQDAAVT